MPQCTSGTLGPDSTWGPSPPLRTQKSQVVSKSSRHCGAVGSHMRLQTFPLDDALATVLHEYKLIVALLPLIWTARENSRVKAKANGSTRRAKRATERKTGCNPPKGNVKGQRDPPRSSNLHAYSLLRVFCISSLFCSTVFFSVQENVHGCWKWTRFLLLKGPIRTLSVAHVC